MTAKEIFQQCSHLITYQQRSVSEEYVEVVFLNKEIFQWQEVLAGILGEPMSAAGIKPTPEALLLANDYGGISEGQTLYKKDFDEGTLLVMFWPWQDAAHTTLKIICRKKKT